MEELKELKSQAYDALANIEYWQAKLQELNKQIAELQAKQEKK